jgi:hypothetical protein
MHMKLFKKLSVLASERSVISMHIIYFGYDVRKAVLSSLLRTRQYDNLIYISDCVWDLINATKYVC